jgi:hypothetical protein
MNAPQLLPGEGSLGHQLAVLQLPRPTGCMTTARREVLHLTFME